MKPPLFIPLLILLLAGVSISLQAEREDGGTKDPIRTRFPVRFKSRRREGEKDAPLIPTLSESLIAAVLNNRTEPESNNNATLIKANRVEHIRRNDYFDTYQHPQPAPPPMPVYPATTAAPLTTSRSPYHNYQKPSVITSYYKPGTGSVTLPPLVIPPEVVGPLGPEPSPPTPIIGVTPGETGEGENLTSEEEEEGEEIFPPSPPEIEELRKRVLPLPKEREKGRSSFLRTQAPGVGKRVRLREKVRTSLEREKGVDETDSLLKVREEEDASNLITDFVFSDIKCFRNRKGEYFGTRIHMKRGYHAPYVRDRPADPLTSDQCRMEAIPGQVGVYHMAVTDLKGCGVEQCGDWMCLTMVFPRVPSLALADDEVTTIKCLPQKSVMSDVRSISFAGDSLEGRRSSSTVEGGKQEFAAEVGVFRQNPGAANGLYVKRVNSGGVVQLGEPLQLRSIVRGGDGWKHSKLSDVKVWRMSDPVTKSLEDLDPNDASEVITLVDSTGCRNLEYAVIAREDPVKDPRNELINHFTFKAFLFRGQRAHEPLILTAKVHACQEGEDCLPRSCSTSSRFRRSPVELRNASAIVHDWDSKLALRVVGMKDHSTSLSEDDFSDSSHGRSLPSPPLTCTEKMAFTGVLGSVIALLLTGIFTALYHFILRGRRSSPEKNRRQGPFQFIEQGQGSQAGHVQGFPPGKRFPIQAQPLPPPPASTNPGQQGQAPSEPPEPERKSKDALTSTEIQNVAKILQQLAGNSEKRGKHKPSSATVYESIRKSKRKKDGVYILYLDKNKGGRPLSAPPSLRGKSRRLKNHRDLEEIETNNSSSDLSSTSSDLSDSSAENFRKSQRNVRFSTRKTVRGLKNRSSHYQPEEAEVSKRSNKVVTGIRRRFSNLQTKLSSSQEKGSFPTRWKAIMPGSGGGSNPPSSSTSDPDSAYYGSELNVNVSAGQVETPVPSSDILRDLAWAAQTRSRSRRGLVLQDGLDLNNNNNNKDSAKDGHIIRRNENSTQILIVPETHL